MVIEHNDLLFTLRGDHPDILAWFGGSNRLRGRAVASPAWDGLVRFTSSRHMFVQMGLPRAVARRHGLPFAPFIQRQSPMWVGFADQQVNGSGPAAICTFAGNPAARLTTAVRGDYFDHGAIQHLSQVILDMLQFFDMKTPASPPGADGEFTERGAVHVPRAEHRPRLPRPVRRWRRPGPAAEPEPRAALRRADRAGHRHPRRGAPDGPPVLLQRTSRAADGTPIHLRMDGPGYDAMDVPDGTAQPELQFTIFVPSAEFFRRLRTSQASLDLQRTYGVRPEDNGLERFITATRRQNFLIPPRRHRAFPLVELA